VPDRAAHTEGARPDERYGAALSRAAQPRHQEVAANIKAANIKAE
jgi:hypothetical protein